MFSREGQTFITDTTGQMRTAAQAYRTAILEGHIRGHTPFSLEGHSEGIGTTDEILWQVPGGTQKPYVYNATAKTVIIVSEDATDNQGGVGAREYTVIGLLLDYSEDTEVIPAHATDGTVAVLGTTEFLRINEVRVTDAGSSGRNVGNIIITESTDTNILSWIEEEDNISFQSVHTVPLGKTLFIEEIKGSAAGTKNVHFHLDVREFGGLFIRKKHRTVNNSPFDMSSLKIPAKADVEVTVHSDVAGGIADMSMEGWVE